MKKGCFSSRRVFHTSVATLAVAFFFVPCGLGQGSLTPPGAPGVTMQTLDQLGAKVDDVNAKVDALGATAEKRSPLDDTHALGDLNNEFAINQPGSYYLTRNVAVTKPNGIQIAVANVTLDLNGFQIRRVGGAVGGDAITIVGVAHGTSVRNGSIATGFSFGIHCISSTAQGCSFRDLVVSSATNYGIAAGTGAAIERCRVREGSGNAAIYALGSSLANCTVTGYAGNFGFYVLGSSLMNCSASENTVGYAIYASKNSSINNCTSTSNTGAFLNSAGIYVGAGSAAVNSISANNATSGSVVPSAGMGFFVGPGSKIMNCTASGNQGDGIKISDRVVAFQNLCEGSGSGGDGAGIHVAGNDNRIEANTATANDRGVQVDGAGNIVIRNTVTGSSGNNWQIASGNMILVVSAGVVGPFTGNSGGASPGSTDPNANLTF